MTPHEDPPGPPLMLRIAAEPLVHFLVLGALLFVAWSHLPASHPTAPRERQIVLTLDDITQLVTVYQAQWKRDPTPDELSRLVDGRVQEEILYREALALGLDKDDAIVRRRLMQKMQFLAEDAAAARAPTSDELRAWYAGHVDAFRMPPRLSFRHLYFSPDLRHARARDDAVAALARLAGRPEDTPLAARLADPSMLPEYYRDRTPEFLGRELGATFVETLERLPPGRWQGPVESGLGWHLVFLDAVTPGRVPTFEEVQSDVRTAWLGEQKKEAWDKAWREIRARYTVLLPAPPDGAAPAGR